MAVKTPLAWILIIVGIILLIIGLVKKKMPLWVSGLIVAVIGILIRLIRAV